jgi:hypothetical protein
MVMGRNSPSNRTGFVRQQPASVNAHPHRLHENEQASTGRLLVTDAAATAAASSK